MQGWYDYGFDGFPKGERRRRFYRQRDDPCDSQEDLSGNSDAEGGASDRPIYYYTLRDDAESDADYLEVATSASSSSFSSQLWSSRSHSTTCGVSSAESFFGVDSDTAESVRHDGGPSAPVRAGARGETSGGTTRKRRRSRTARCSSEGRRPSVTQVNQRSEGFLTATSHEDPRLASRYGASCSAFPMHVCDEDFLVVVQYGGMVPHTAPSSPCGTKTPQGSAAGSALDDFTVMAVSARCVSQPLLHRRGGDEEEDREDGSSKFVSDNDCSSLVLEGFDKTLTRCDPLPSCSASSLGKAADWTRLHPALREVNPALVATGVAPPRVGHCSQPLVLSTPDAARRLFASADSTTTTTETAADQRSPSSSPSSLLDVKGGVAHGVHLLLSLVLGGSATLINQRTQHHGGSTRLMNCRLGSQVLSMPALCVTVVLEEERLQSPHQDHSRCSSGAAMCLSHCQLYFPLLSAPHVISTLESVAFPTLTPWPTGCRNTAAAPANVDFSFVVMGGTANGWRPNDMSTVTLLDVDCGSWTWTATDLFTYGAEPPARFAHSASFLSGSSSGGGGGASPGDANGKILIFGGIGSQREYLHDVYVLGVSTRVWREVSAPLASMPTCRSPALMKPSGRAFHAAVLLTHPKCRQAWEGGGSAELDTRSRSFDAYLDQHMALQSVTRVADDTPSVRQDILDTGHSALDGEGEGAEVLIMGGEGDRGAESAVWSLNTKTYQWRRWCFPCARFPQCVVQQPSSSPSGAAAVERFALPRVMNAEDLSTLENGLEINVEEGSTRRFGGGRSHSDRSLECAYFASCVGSLPQVVVLPLPPCTGERVPLDVSADCLGLRRDDDDCGVLVFGGSASLGSTFLTTTLAPCGTSLRALSRMEWMSRWHPQRQHQKK